MVFNRKVILVSYLDFFNGKAVSVSPFLKHNKMSQNNSNTSSGIGFTGLLTIVFVVLKLTKVIDWSWWWVTSPMWIPITLVLAVVIVIGFMKVMAILALNTFLKEKK